MILYLDSSALVKLLRRETESDELRRYLVRHGGDERVTSTLARVEVVRAVRASGGPAVARARRQLARIHQVPMDRTLMDEAATVGDVVVRSLDAIHLASARRLGPELRATVTYDVHMQHAATELGLAVAAPA